MHEVDNGFLTVETKYFGPLIVNRDGRGESSSGAHSRAINPSIFRTGSADVIHHCPIHIAFSFQGKIRKRKMEKLAPHAL